MKNSSSHFLILCILALLSCKTKEITPIPPTLDIVNVSEINISSAKISTNILNLGNQYISEFGFVYSETNPTPIITDSKLSHGDIKASNSTSLKFNDELQNLKLNTNYYIRSYTTIASGTIYGQVTQFKTLDIIQPAIKTDAVILVFTTTAKLRGIIETKGTYDISEYGFCWSSSNNLPTTADTMSSKKINPTIFPTIYTEDISDLTPNTTYYFRAFIISNGVTTYGNSLTFKTLAITQPTIKTLEAVTTSTTSVKIKGLAEFGGNSDNITEYGICLSQRFTTPTVDNSIKVKVLENITVFPKTFTADIYSLNGNTEIYYRAYIISNSIVSYGEVKTYKLEIEGFPTIITGDATSLSATSQRIQGTISTKGDYPITEYGVCWSYINGFSNTLPLTCLLGSSIQGSPIDFPATFSIDATKLNSGVVYMYRAFVVANGITTYGNEKYFIKSSN